MQNGDKALPSINSAGQGLLVKMLITLESLGIFDQISHTYTTYTSLDTGMQNGDEASPSVNTHNSWSVGENAHNS